MHEDHIRQGHQGVIGSDGVTPESRLPGTVLRNRSRPFPAQSLKPQEGLSRGHLLRSGECCWAFLHKHTMYTQ